MKLNPLTDRISEEIEYICKLLYETLKVPVYFMDTVNHIVFTFAYDQILNPLYEDKTSYFIKLFEVASESNRRPTTNFSTFHVEDKEPIMRSGLFSENYLSVPFFYEHLYRGRFIMGPSAPFYMPSGQIDHLMGIHEIPFNLKRILTAYLSAMPIIDYNRLLRISQLIYYMIYKETLDLPRLLEKSSSLVDLATQMSHQYDQTVSSNRIQTFFHHTLEHENHILQCIREGNMTLLSKAIDQAQDGEPGILSRDNPLRSQKNLGICLVTLATRAAIEGGLNTEQAFTLSDLYIQEIERVNNVNDLSVLRNQMLHDFTNQVIRLKQAAYSKPIAQSLQLIVNRLYEPLTISELAKAVSLSAHYFADRFKKEVGLPVMTYIQRQKIEEAKRLLTSSNYSILEVSNILGYHDQSHFTKLFQKWVGVTPRKYRK